MYPINKHSALKATLVVIAMFAVESPAAIAHGGGGGGHGGHSGGHGAGASNGEYAHSSGAYRGYGAMGPYFGRSGTGASIPTEPVWEGFPEDLPFARLKRFVAGHVHSVHWPFHHVS
jgi:hypothetical protein